MPLLQGLFLFVFGLLVGSMLNQIIHRLPRGDRLYAPGFQCPFCHHPLSVADIIPIVSFVYLRGCCRYCFAKIFYRYPLLEGLTGVVFILCRICFGWTVSLLAALSLIAVLIICIFAYHEHQIILDEVLLFGAIVSLALNISFSALCTWYEMFVGAAVGAGLTLLTAMFVRRITGKRSVNVSDAKLMAMIGGFLGWECTLVSILLSVAGGCVIVLAFRAGGVKQRLPYTFILCAGAAATLFIGHPLIAWFTALLA